MPLLHLYCVISCYSVFGGSVAEWFRALVLQSGGPGFKASTLPLAGFVSR